MKIHTAISNDQRLMLADCVTDIRESALKIKCESMISAGLYFESKIFANLH